MLPKRRVPRKKATKPASKKKTKKKLKKKKLSSKEQAKRAARRDVASEGLSYCESSAWSDIAAVSRGKILRGRRPGR
ncbi:MAG: hypothetical protein CL943_02665 [Candidatus Diapherotrites archaeon]|uniref:Uncharacterized protein n=1 Tax=Candidatus Iainarchaeum sp. TaxID=3101447 RepID=A0A2D6M183_9ARCH|nr:hypothetical protein [Candidatus Diapherotrites archaeon]|tara:strand:- start:3364 stop:3594 length:231 start_codon:yes stop_codon:yes gene_type:complete